MASVKRVKRRRNHTFIRQWREFRGLTQARASERIGISRENYGRIESGKVPYNQDFLEICAGAFNCTVTDLLSRDPTMESIVDQLHALMARASESQQNNIVAIAKTLIENKG